MAAFEGDHWELWAVSPLDGRYRRHLKGLGQVVSEGALIGYRTRVEVAWLSHLADQPELADLVGLTPALRRTLEHLGETVDAGAASDWQQQIKEIERTTNHDVKAVEYYLQHRLRSAGASDRTLAFIHFACTSEDINNLAYALMLRDVRDLRLLPLMDGVIADLAALAEAEAATPMLSRTHGQTASPTTLGKELAVFGARLLAQRQRLLKLPIAGKINGAVGNYNAHRIAFPDLDWPQIAQSFVEDRLRLAFNPLTTQIENHDALVEYASILRHFNTIALGLCRDLWGYVSLGYLAQKPVAGEVGSSTMPHKVNPIDFENAEGNLGLANAVAEHFAAKLPISRWQRDLSDSTVQRAIGTMVGHTELAWRSLRRGLSKVSPERGRLAADLDDKVEVLAEAVQTVMRRYGVVDAYERLKAATRGQAVTRATLDELIDGCDALPGPVRVRLKELSPASYTGDAERLAREFVATARALGLKSR